MTACEWKVLSLIGEGVQSKVFLAENMTDKKKYALKLFSRETQSTSEEIELVSNLQNESIIQVKDRIDSVDSLSFGDLRSEEEFNRGYVMEYAAHSDFFNFLANLGPLPGIIVRSYARQLISALEYLHAQGIAHGGLELENLLLDENFCLKLAGFSASKSVEAGERRYDSSESHVEGENDVFSADVFSLGVILFELICGHSPFERASLDDELYQLIAENKWEEFWLFHQEMCSYNYVALYSDTKELLQSLLNADSTKRPALRDIKSFEWMKKTSIDRLNVGAWLQEIAKKKKAVSVLSPVSSL